MSRWQAFFFAADTILNVHTDTGSHLARGTHPRRNADCSTRQGFADRRRRRVIVHSGSVQTDTRRFNALRRQNYSLHLMIRTSVYVCARAETPPRKRTHAHAQTCIQTCTGAQTDIKLERQKRRNWRMVVALLVKTLLACLFFLAQTYCFAAVI